jgi:hypothetical protein
LPRGKVSFFETTIIADRNLKSNVVRLVQ